MTSDQTAETAVASPLPRRPRCEECWDIKRKRAEALAAGDRAGAAAMATAMGVHQRVAHSCERTTARPGEPGRAVASGLQRHGRYIPRSGPYQTAVSSP